MKALYNGGTRQGRLAPSVVIKIFKASGTYREIADRFSISLSTVHSIKKKKRWKKVTDGVAQ